MDFSYPFESTRPYGTRRAKRQPKCATRLRLLRLPAPNPTYDWNESDDWGDDPSLYWRYN